MGHAELSDLPRCSDPGILSKLWGFEEAAQRILSQAGFWQEAVEAEFAERSGNRAALLKSRRWLHSRGLDARCCLIASPQAEILNLMIFSSAADACPVFASEIILFGSKIRVAVIDHQSPDRQMPLRKEIEAKLGALQARYQPQLTPGGELPEWAKAHFTSACIYCRPSTPEETPVVEQAFEDYLQMWVADWLPRSAPEPAAQEILSAYQFHHVENTPGRPFLSQVFGAEWTEKYLRQFMYAPLRWTL